MEKRKFLWLFLIILAAIIAIVFFSLRTKATIIATLNIEQGTVEVDLGKGWQKAQDGMELSSKAKVRTLQDSIATLLLYDSIIVRLSENTEVSLEKLEENLTLKQNSGTTWNKFLHLAGIKSYSVETPTTTATVRGTGFLVAVSQDETEVSVSDGEVEIKTRENEIRKLKEFERIVKRRGKPLMRRALTLAQKEKIRKHLMKDIEFLKRRRLRRIISNKIVMAMLHKYNVSEKELPKWLEKIDREEINVSEIMRRTPTPLKRKFLDRLQKETEEIVRINRRLRRLEELKVKS